MFVCLRLNEINVACRALTIVGVGCDEGHVTVVEKFGVLVLLTHVNVIDMLGNCSVHRCFGSGTAGAEIKVPSVENLQLRNDLL